MDGPALRSDSLITELFSLMGVNINLPVGQMPHSSATLALRAALSLRLYGKVVCGGVVEVMAQRIQAKCGISIPTSVTELLTTGVPAMLTIVGARRMEKWSVLVQQGECMAAAG